MTPFLFMFVFGFAFGFLLGLFFAGMGDVR